MMRSLHVAVALMLMPAALAQHPVMEIKVAGNERLAASAVIAASGLRKGQTATRAELDAAAQKLADTGFFIHQRQIPVRSEGRRRCHWIRAHVSGLRTAGPRAGRSGHSGPGCRAVVETTQIRRRAY